MLAARWIAAALFVLAVPVFLLLTNVRIAATDERVYDYAFNRYDAEERTGVDRAELDGAARTIIAYFESGEDDALLDIRVGEGEAQEPLFNQREVLHMRDVKSLMQSAFRVHELAFVYLVGYVAAVYLWSRERSMRRLARQVMIAGGGTAAALTLAALSMLVGFDTLFTQFHVLSFSNDLWMLNPETDRLLQMFPQGFWFDVSFAVGVLTVAQGGLLALLGWGYQRWLDRRPRRRRVRPASTQARSAA